MNYCEALIHLGADYIFNDLQQKLKIKVDVSQVFLSTKKVILPLCQLFESTKKKKNILKKVQYISGEKILRNKKDTFY